MPDIHHRDTQPHPKAVIWLESSVTSLHLLHMAQLSKAMGARGIDVCILASEDTIKQFEKNGGKMTADRHCAADSKIDFGKNARFLPELASQTTHENDLSIPYVQDYRLKPFDFIGSKEIFDRRYHNIERAIGAEKPDMLVTSLWPGGYGPFTTEIQGMIYLAKDYKPHCKVYSLSNDIPYLDHYYNHPVRKARHFDLVDRVFVRGDGTIPLDEAIPLSGRNMQKVEYVGHFVNPLPPRTPMPEEQRKVLVTYDRHESSEEGEHPLDYFFRIMDIACQSKYLHDHTWELIVGPNCPSHDLREIRAEAKRLNKEEGMNFKVRREIPAQKRSQEIADAAMRIAPYDIFVLDDVSTGVPAFLTTGTLGRFQCGANEGDDRLENLRRIGAPITYLDQNDILTDPGIVVSRIDSAYKNSKSKAFRLNGNAPDKAADWMAADYRAQHAQWQPDPVIASADKITHQGERSRKHGR